MLTIKSAYINGINLEYMTTGTKEIGGGEPAVVFIHGSMLLMQIILL
jgi:hypothetical protein